MPQKTSPFVESKYGWDFGESGWNTGADENFLKFAYLHDANIDGVVSTLPLPAVNGKAYFLTSDNRVYYAVDGTYNSTPVPTWFTLHVRGTGAAKRFTGSSLVDIDTEETLRQSITDLESSLGTAAYQDSSAFITPTQLSTSLTPINSQITSLSNNQGRYFESYGAIGDGIADDTAAIQAALDDTDYFLFKTKPGKTYNITAITLSRSNVEIVIDSGSVISCQNPTARSITISGDSCTLSGKGTIRGLPVFDGANVRPTYAMVWVTGNYLKVRDITFDTIPKEGLMFEDSTYHTVIGCKFIGRYPQASYDEDTTTNHCAILSNIPASSSHPSPYLKILGNTFEETIQGVLSLNYGSAGNNTGILISGNNFKNCWDHGVYLSRGLAHTVTSNSFLDCRRPIVSDGIGSVVVGNTLYSTLTTSNGEQMMSVRESSYSVISNNALYGKDASIFVDNIETTDCIGNIVSNNIIKQTSSSFATSAIRLNGAQVCRDNSIINNSIEATSIGSANYLIDLQIVVGFFGNNNYIQGNALQRADVGGCIRVNRHNRTLVKDNILTFTGATASTVTLNAILSTNSAYMFVEGNLFNYRSGGGANITYNIVNLDAGASGSYVKRSIVVTQVTLSGAGAVIVAPTGVELKENVFDSTSTMSGKFTIASGTNTLSVSNSNVRPSSIIVITPTTSASASLMATTGVYIIPGTQSFSANTPSNTTVACEFTYNIY